MGNIGIGILFVIFSLFLYFVSPSENKNLLGYKSPQQGANAHIWKWSNKCFGMLALIGSVLYLISSIVLGVLELQDYGSIQNKIAIAYLVVCVIVTEIYTLIRSCKKDKGNREHEI